MTSSRRAGPRSDFPGSRMGNALLALIGALFVHCAAAEPLTVISFGRADQQALSRAYYGPFRALTGIDVKAFSYDGQTTELDQMVRSGKPDWDVIQVESRTLQLGCEQGLFEKLDYHRIGNPGDLIPGALSECGVGIFTWSMALAYDADKVKGAPTTWADLWDLKKYPGKRGLRRSAKYTLEIALLADGVEPHDVYKVLATEQGVDRAFRKLDRIKSNVVWWEAAAQPAAYLANGNLVMTSAYSLWLDRQRLKPADRRRWRAAPGPGRLSGRVREHALAARGRAEQELKRRRAGPLQQKRPDALAPGRGLLSRPVLLVVVGPPDVRRLPVQFHDVQSAADPIAAVEQAPIVDVRVAARDVQRAAGHA